MIGNIDKAACTAFLAGHGTAVLSTLASDLAPHGSCIYYILHEDEIYFVTRTGTQKFRNIVRDPRVAVTVYDETSQKVFEASGRAAILQYEDTKSRKDLYDKLVANATHRSGTKTAPPAMDRKQGGLVVFQIKIAAASFMTYGLDALAKEAVSEL